MNIEVGKVYIVSNNPREIGSPFHYLLGQPVEVTGTEEVLGKIPIKVLCEIPEGAMIASRIRPDLLEEQKD